MRASPAVRVRSVESHFDVDRVREDFPILAREVHGKPLVYLDNAATSQKPQMVLDAVLDYYRAHNANVHRGVHTLSQEATAAYEQAREKVRGFLGAGSTEEIVFVRGATEALNLVAQSYGRSRLREGDEVLVSAMEHHSNIVPWQLICEERGCRLRVIPMSEDGELLLEQFRALLSDRTRMVALGHVSNALGTINPVREVAALAHEIGAIVVVDGAQGAPHLRIDVRDLDVDFYAISGHKMFGPTGIGALFGRRELMDAMPPYQGGGEMIRHVTFDKTEFAPLPARFEAGTPNIAGAVGLGAAIDYLNALPWSAVENHEADLLTYGTERLETVGGVRIIGRARNKASVLSFLMEGVHAHDVGTVVDLEGVAIRTGHHCAQPVMDFYGVAATARASLAFYNTRDDIDALVAALHKVHEVFR